MKIEVEQDVMQVNRTYAAQNRADFSAQRLCVVNILGSPGAGKTTLLERLLPLLQAEGITPAVIEGDLATAKDAARIAESGVPVVQINTDGGCHLDAKMIARVLPAFDLASLDLLLIENVGNLVCPASFDLGEDVRIVVLSVPEGGDKPSKYPATFLSAGIVVLNKMDLTPYVEIDLAAVHADILALKPDMRIIETSCRRGMESGLEELATELVARMREKLA